MPAAPTENKGLSGFVSQSDGLCCPDQECLMLPLPAEDSSEPQSPGTSPFSMTSRSREGCLRKCLAWLRIQGVPPFRSYYPQQKRSSSLRIAFQELLAPTPGIPI